MCIFHEFCALFFPQKLQLLCCILHQFKTLCPSKKGKLLRSGFKISKCKIDNDMAEIVSNCKMFILHFVVTLKDILMIIVKCRRLDEEASLLGKDLDRV